MGLWWILKDCWDQQLLFLYCYLWILKLRIYQKKRFDVRHSYLFLTNSHLITSVSKHFYIFILHFTSKKQRKKLYLKKCFIYTHNLYNVSFTQFSLYKLWRYYSLITYYFKLNTCYSKLARLLIYNCNLFVTASDRFAPGSIYTKPCIRLRKIFFFRNFLGSPMIWLHGRSSILEKVFYVEKYFKRSTLRHGFMAWPLSSLQ